MCARQHTVALVDADGRSRWLPLILYMPMYTSGAALYDTVVGMSTDVPARMNVNICELLRRKSVGICIISRSKNRAYQAQTTDVSFSNNQISDPQPNSMTISHLSIALQRARTP